MVCCIEFIQSLGFQIVLKVSHLPSISSRANVHFSDNFSASGLYNSTQHTTEVVYSQNIALHLYYIISYHIISYHIISYHIIYYYFTLYHIFFSIRQAEHEDTRKFSEPARHSASHPGHTFQWKILAFASSWILRRTREAIFIAKLGPNLNKQVHSFHLILSPNGIT